jgi:hypothetical protein
MPTPVTLATADAGLTKTLAKTSQSQKPPLVSSRRSSAVARGAQRSRHRPTQVS